MQVVISNKLPHNFNAFTHQRTAGVEDQAVPPALQLACVNTVYMPSLRPKVTLDAAAFGFSRQTLPVHWVQAYQALVGRGGAVGFVHSAEGLMAKFGVSVRLGAPTDIESNCLRSIAAAEVHAVGSRTSANARIRSQHHAANSAPLLCKGPAVLEFIA